MMIMPDLKYQSRYQNIHTHTQRPLALINCVLMLRDSHLETEPKHKFVKIITHTQNYYNVSIALHFKYVQSESCVVLKVM